MDKNKAKQLKRGRRRGRIRAKISGTAECPRLSVFRSNTNLYVQLIDDVKGATLVCADSREIKNVKGLEASKELGKAIAGKAKAKKIEQIVFDRGGYRYHGNVKSLAEGAREGGLKF